MAAPTKHVIGVTILGERYTIRATEDPAYVERVAQYVEEKLTEAIRESSSLPSSKAVVLASLNIADDLFKREADRARSEAAIAARLGELSELLRAEIE
jgi:cell division protein ZapA